MILTLDFDWAVISGKKKFRWPLVGSVYIIGQGADHYASL